ncbi:DUF3467 domain-containing protein [Deinococcus yavapaiensis]|uniref:Uncharacterized protein DUF3467 n=1 Tax=Deinococcus yavapaiensis KR-236 TaxID=694435 RepID=A0A318S9Y6_9DEIO|nr:DUF3467 domain-containing protein [Deinococcus yavapaiensis]PYE53300.1 uncharacterized protein DUF3467 [Deinococcus yavapaiensis KR-236]
MTTNIRVPSDIKPLYANFAVLDTTRDEVLLNFCFAEGPSDKPEASLVAKIVMTPTNLKNLHDRIGELLEHHQMRHGPMK